MRSATRLTAASSRKKLQLVGVFSVFLLANCIPPKSHAEDHCPRILENSEPIVSNYLSSSNTEGQPQVVSIIFNPQSKDSQYTLEAPGRAPKRYSISDISNLAAHMKKVAGENDILYWIPQGFSDARIDALEKTIQVQWNRTDSKVLLRSIRLESNPALPSIETDISRQLPELFFVRGAKIDSVIPPKMTSSGAWQGWYQVIIKTAVRIGATLKTMTITILVKSADHAGTIGRIALNLASKSTNNDKLSGALVVADIYHQLHALYPDLNRQQIRILMQEEFSKNYIVLNDGQPDEREYDAR